MDKGDKIFFGLLITAMVVALVVAIIYRIQREQYLVDKPECERYANLSLHNVPAKCVTYFTER